MISVSSVSSSIRSNAQLVGQKIYNAVSDCEINNKAIIDFFDKVGKKVSSPEQRLILGVTALASQPFIDGHNKRVDKETRKVSVARTVAKIIAGTLTGVLIRRGCIKGIDCMSKIAKEGEVLPKWKQFFTPAVKNLDIDAFKQYKNALGTITALVVMLFTNFLIDAPLTKYLTNLFVAKADEKAKGGKV